MPPEENRPDAECSLCDLRAGLASTEEAVEVCDGWWINETQGESLRRGFVLQHERHRTSIGAMTLLELTSMGRAMGRVDRALRRDSRVANVYFQTFNETPPGHPHIHVQPRFIDDDVRGPQLIATPNPERPVALSELESNLRRAPRATFSDAPIVRWVRAPLAFWNSRISAYPLFRSLLNNGVIRDHGALYTGVWLAMLLIIGVGLWWLWPPAPWLQVGALVVGLYRFFDLASFVASMLLSGGTRLQSPERSLILFAVNLVELSAIAFIVGISTGITPHESLAAAGAYLSAQGLAIDDANAWLLIGLALFNFVHLLVIATAVSLVIGKIAEQISSDRDRQVEN